MEPTAHPEHVMAEVWVQAGPSGVPEQNGTPPRPAAPRPRSLGRLQDSRSLDGISLVCGTEGKAEPGRRATISSALELEGTVSHEGQATHFTANNLQLKIKLSSLQSLDSDNSVRSPSLQRHKADIPPIDPEVLKDLERLTQDVAHKVDQMMKSLNGTIQNGMYTLMARCEELDRSMQPIHALAQQIREIKRTLDIFETLCK